jgi:phage terminase small subunit
MPGGRPKGHPKSGGKKKGAMMPATVRKAAEHVEAVKLTVARVLEEYAHIGMLDATQAFDADGNMKRIADWPESLRRSIAGIEFEERFEVQDRQRVHVGRLHKIKIANKLGALDSIAKHLGMFVEKHRFVDADGRDRPFLLSDADRLISESDAADATG